MNRFALVLPLIASSAIAYAQPAGAQAEVLFKEGRELMVAGKYAEACAAFEQCQKLDPTQSTLLHLADCREKAGQLATAWGLFLEAERQTRTATDAATQQLHGVAQDRAKKLELRVSKLAINVPQKSQIEGLVVTCEQDRVDAVMWNRALPIDGGTYTIKASAPGANEWSTRITVGTESDTKTIEVPDLRNSPRDMTPSQPAQPAAGAPANDAVEESPDTSTNSGNKLVPLAVGGAAVALLGGALGFHLWGNATYDDAKAEMVDQDRRDSLYDSANTKRYVAEGLAVAGIGVAVWLYLRERGEHSPPATARRRVVVSPGGIALIGTF